MRKRDESRRRKRSWRKKTGKGQEEGEEENYDDDDDDEEEEEEEDVANQRRLYLYRHHFIDSMLGCSRRHNAVTGHFSFEQEATTFVPYFCCLPHFVF